MEREAHYDNRIYFFELIKHEKDEVRVKMYNTDYIFRKEGDKWVNHKNKMNMNASLIDAVIKEVQGS